MKNKILALLLVFTLIAGSTAYAVPLDLWSEDARVESLYTTESVADEFDVVQEILDYIGIAAKEDISGDDSVKASVILRALGKIVGFEYGEEIGNKVIIQDLKSAKFLRDDAKASLLSLQDLLYAATRITGWCEVIDIDAVVLTEAKKAGLMRNLAFSSDRNLTKSEAAQLLYNIISVPVKRPKGYEPGVVSLDKKTERPVIETKYGITLKSGVVTSVFGESIYNTNTLDPDEIEIDNVVYRFSEEEDRTGLIGRSIVYFMDIEDQFVIFAEPTTKNVEHIINYGEKPVFKVNEIKYENDDEEEFLLTISSSAKVILNGLYVGAYTPELMNRFFGGNTNITAVDNDDDGNYDYLFIKEWQTFVVDTAAGPGGVFTFAYDRTYNGLGYFDISPDDKKLHVNVIRNGEPSDYTHIADGSIVSISATLNETGHRYVTVETGYSTVTGVFNSADADSYVVEGNSYPVAKEYLELQKTNYDVKTPQLGETYNFYIDITGRIVNADVSNEYTFGYIVSMNQERGLDKPYTFKIFSQDGKMYEMPLAEKVTLYTPEKPSGEKMEADSFAELIYNAGAEKDDYRCFIQYKLLKGELSEVWLALDNTSAEAFGEAGYQFTLDMTNTSDVEYTGGLIEPFENSGSSFGDGWACWGKSTILFAIPTDKNAHDAKYQIRSPAYNGSRWVGATDFYCVDDWHMIEAAILHMPPEAYIDNYSPLYVVDKVVASVNNITGDPCYKIYGNASGEDKSVFIGEEVVSTAGAGGWASGITATDLRFGDIVQVSQVDGQADSLRVVYRHEDGIDDFSKSEKGPDTGGKLEIDTGSYGGRRNSIYRFQQTANGKTVSFMKVFSATSPVYVVDLSAKSVTKASFADLTIGDKLVVHSKWGTVVNTYVFKK